MGKFNWKGAAQGALGSLYQSWEAGQEEKRAYERQDREMAQQLYAKMLASGIDPGPNKYISEEIAALGKTYRDRMTEAEAKQFDIELEQLKRKTRAELSVKAEFPEEEKVPFGEQQFYDWVGGKEAYDAMPNDQKRAAMRSFAQRSRKEGGEGEGKKPRFHITKDDEGNIVKINPDTNATTIVKPVSEAEKKKRAEKEQNAKKATDAKNAAEARKVLSDFYKIDDAQKETLLPSINATLADIGWEIAPKTTTNKGLIFDSTKTIWEARKIAAQGQTFNDKHIQVTAAKTGKSPQEVKAMLEAKGLIYAPE